MAKRVFNNPKFYNERFLKDFQHDAEECKNINEFKSLLHETVQKTIGASGIVVVPFYKNNEHSKPEIIVCSEVFSSEETATQIVSALPLIDKELGPVTDILSRKVRTYCLDHYFGVQYLEKTKTYNKLCRPFQAEQLITGIMGSLEHPLGIVCLTRSAKEPCFSEQNIVFAEKVRGLTERALFNIINLNHSKSLQWSIVKDMAAMLPVKSAVLNAEGCFIWFNKTAKQELDKHIWGIANCYYLCSENKTIASWRDTVFQMKSENLDYLKTSNGLSAIRFASDNNTALYLIMDEPVWNKTDIKITSKELSPREKQIAQMASEGYTPINIAAIHNISVGTVRNHLKSIYRKLNISSKMELVLRYK